MCTYIYKYTYVYYYAKITKLNNITPPFAMKCHNPKVNLFIVINN